MARILVTGAAGFIGSSLVDALLARGDEVTGFDNFDPFYDPSIKRANLVQALENPRFQLIEGDLRVRDQIQQCVLDSKPEQVVHLAALAGVRPSLDRPQAYEEVNVGGTILLMEAMLQLGRPHLIFGSTSSVYGDSSTPPFSEKERADQPCSPYTATKRSAELLTYTYHHLYQLPVTNLRFFTVYGPRQRPEMAIHRFARLMVSGRPIPVFGDGLSSRDYTYIDDILDGVVKAIDYSAGFDCFNLGESKVTELRRLIELLEQALGVDAIVDRQEMQPGDVPITYANIDHARECLGYDPKVDIGQGIQKFVTWFRGQNP